MDIFVGAMNTKDYVKKMGGTKVTWDGKTNQHALNIDGNRILYQSVHKAGNVSSLEVHIAVQSCLWIELPLLHTKICCPAPADYYPAVSDQEYLQLALQPDSVNEVDSGLYRLEGTSSYCCFLPGKRRSSGELDQGRTRSITLFRGQGGRESRPLGEYERRSSVGGSCGPGS